LPLTVRGLEDRLHLAERGRRSGSPRVASEGPAGIRNRPASPWCVRLPTSRFPGQPSASFRRRCGRPGFRTCLSAVFRSRRKRKASRQWWPNRKASAFRAAARSGAPRAKASVD